jgi:hypothetical protein
MDAQDSQDETGDKKAEHSLFGPLLVRVELVQFSEGIGIESFH